MNQAEGNKYVTSSLVLPFINTYMTSLAEHGSIKKSWFGPANPWCEFPVSSAHESIKTRLSIMEDLEDLTCGGEVFQEDHEHPVRGDCVLCSVRTDVQDAGCGVNR